MVDKDDSLDFSVPEIIRRLRRDLKLTQAELAAAIGLAPTSIYRYEAGSSSPSLETIKRLYDLASEKKSGSADFFAGALLGDAPAAHPAADYPRSRRSIASPLSAIAVDGQFLSPREQLAVIAFVLMMRNNTSDVTENILRALLDPWMGEARVDLESMRTLERPTKRDE